LLFCFYSEPPIPVARRGRGHTGVRPGQGLLAGGGVAERDYAAQASAGIEALQRWYRPRTGRWRTAGWWNAANALTAVIGYIQCTGDQRYLGVVEQTFVAAQRRHRDFIVSFYDDNGWWGLAFLDAYQATGVSSYLKEAERAFDFIARAGWNERGGGLWWNTSHPYIAGEPLAAGSLLGARLSVLTGQSGYRTEALKFLDWADASFTTERHLYKRTDSDPTPTPYIEGTFVEAWQVLCRVGVPGACARAAGLANASAERFSDRLNMGPQFDTIYLHWMLLYGVQAGEARWRTLAEEMATDAQARARDGQGLYLKAWDGSPITQHQAQPNMLQSDAATLELFAWLAVPPQALAARVSPARLASRAKATMKASTTKASNWVPAPWRSSAKAAS